MSKLFKTLVFLIMGSGFVWHMITLSGHMNIFIAGIVFILFALSLIIPLLAMRTNEYSYDKNDLIMIYNVFPMTFLSIGALFILLGFIKIIFNDNNAIINELIKFGPWIGGLAVILTLSYQFYVKYKQVEITRIYKNKNSYRLYLQHIHNSIAQYGMEIFLTNHSHHESFKVELYERERSVQFIDYNTIDSDQINKDYQKYIEMILSTNEKSLLKLREGGLNSDEVVLKRIKRILTN
jgi:hypothetical protein